MIFNKLKEGSEIIFIGWILFVILPYIVCTRFYSWSILKLLGIIILSIFYIGFWIWWIKYGNNWFSKKNKDYYRSEDGKNKEMLKKD